jgi:uncharacterized protein (DUF58 family)
VSQIAALAGTVPLAAEMIAQRAWIHPLPGVQPARPRPLAPGLPGGHAGAGRGRGLELAELRPFQPGDDVRSIDWRRSARHGVPCTKLFQEEREHALKLVVDLGPAMRFGTRVAYKSVAAANAAALLAWAAAEAGDRIGGLAWDGRRWTEARPRARRAGVLELVRLLAAPPSPARNAEDFAAGLRRLAARLGSGDQVVVLSDFRSLDEAAEQSLIAIGRRANCLLVHVHDPLEAAPPPPGLYALTDGARETLLDYTQPELRTRHTEAFAAHVARLAALAGRAGARLTSLSTEAAPAQVLAACRY